jgi:membrane protease YdiL (CAAX protease family)
LFDSSPQARVLKSLRWYYFYTHLTSQEERLLTKKITLKEKSRYQLADHPWISLGIEWIISIGILLITIAAANWLGVPGDSPCRPLFTPTIAHILVLFLVVPFVLQLPNGKTTLKKYLEDIRLSIFKPFLPLVLLGLSSSLIILLLLMLNSFIFRLYLGVPIDAYFLQHVIDLRLDLPPQSMSWIIALPSIFEEVSWRGVALVLFMKKYSAKHSILITALGFGFFHLLNLLGETPPDFVLRQVVFGSTLGFFYGFMVLRTNSLFPAMLFHFLVNMFIGSFTHYFQFYASAKTQIFYTLINLPVATVILIGWVRYFCQRWLLKTKPANLLLYGEKNYES